METIEFMREILTHKLESQKCIEFLQYHSRPQLHLITLEDSMFVRCDRPQTEKIESLRTKRKRHLL